MSIVLRMTCTETLSVYRTTLYIRHLPVCMANFLLLQRQHRQLFMANPKRFLSILECVGCIEIIRWILLWIKAMYTINQKCDRATASIYDIFQFLVLFQCLVILTFHIALADVLWFAILCCIAYFAMIAGA